jgi:hypothetical protein
MTDIKKNLFNTKGKTNEQLNDKIDEIKLTSKNIKERFIKRNEVYDMYHENNQKRMNIEYERDLKNHLQRKLNRLDERLKVLQMKYNTYKKWYDRFNIIIIVISSGLSVFEALRSHIDDKITEETGFYYFFNMIPITFSSTITCTAAIIKFKKYQEKMENMQFTREKVILAISKIKEIQESLWFNDEKSFPSIKKKYLEDVYHVYNESNSELERHIKYNDYEKYRKNYAKNNEKNKKLEAWNYV